MLDFGFASEQEARTELCKRLRAQRLVKGLSQAELAEWAGISVSTVKLIENKGQCTLENFMRMVTSLGLAEELQPLFVLKPKSIAQMEQAEQANRVRAPRKARTLGACRTWGIESENRPQRGQFLPDLQAPSPAMGQKDGEKWTAVVDLQPTLPKSDRLLERHASADDPTRTAS